MNLKYIEDESFSGVNFQEKGFEPGNYENCTFENCNFSEVKLGQSNFIECEFTGCNFSMSLPDSTGLRDVFFKDCKMMGFRFDYCSEFLFQVQFEDCAMDYSSFYQLKVPQTTFENCSLKEVDFTGANLTKSKLTNCNLLDAVFDNTLLEHADLTSASNFRIDPENNYIRKAKFSYESLPGLLTKYELDIH